MRQLQIYLDEDPMDCDLVAALRSRGVTVITVLDSRLQADNESGRRARGALTAIELLQAALGRMRDGVDYVGETAMVLQADHVGFAQHRKSIVHEVRGLQLFAAETHQHRFAHQVGMERDVFQDADGDGRARRIDGHAAAVGVGHRHHVVDVGEAQLDELICGAFAQAKASRKIENDPPSLRSDLDETGRI